MFVRQKLLRNFFLIFPQRANESQLMSPQKLAQRNAGEEVVGTHDSFSVEIRQRQLFDDRFANLYQETQLLLFSLFKKMHSVEYISSFFTKNSHS